MRIHRLVPFVLVALAACSSQPQAQGWEKPDHTPAGVSDISYCRQESRRQANTLYPPQPTSSIRDAPPMTDNRNFRAEMSFYDQCMARLGYVRAPER